MDFFSILQGRFFGPCHRRQFSSFNVRKTWPHFLKMAEFFGNVRVALHWTLLLECHL